MAFQEWLVINTKELDETPFPEVAKSMTLENFFNQEYRIWQTDKSISLYQPGRFVMRLWKELGGITVGYGENEFLRLEPLADGSYNVYHGQNR